jgi:hypothetical protein
MTSPTAGQILAAALEWRVAGDGTPPPPEIADLPADERAVLWQGADELYRVVEEKFAGMQAPDDLR